jgi:uncharacterized protein YjhX (UPF0386 family)
VRVLAGNQEIEIQRHRKQRVTECKVNCVCRDDLITAAAVSYTR